MVNTIRNDSSKRSDAIPKGSKHHTLVMWTKWSPDSCTEGTERKHESQKVQLYNSSIFEDFKGMSLRQNQRFPFQSSEMIVTLLRNYCVSESLRGHNAPRRICRWEAWLKYPQITLIYEKEIVILLTSGNLKRSLDGDRCNLLMHQNKSASDNCLK